MATAQPNNLVGSVPPSIGNLTELTELGVFNNPGLADSAIPSTIGELSKLRRVHLYGNHFGGTIPPSIGALSGLEKLMLCENRLSGSIPSSCVHNTINGTCPPCTRTPSLPLSLFINYAGDGCWLLLWW